MNVRNLTFLWPTKQKEKQYLLYNLNKNTNHNYGHGHIDILVSVQWQRNIQSILTGAGFSKAMQKLCIWHVATFSDHKKENLQRLALNDNLNEAYEAIDKIATAWIIRMHLLPDEL